MPPKRLFLAVLCVSLALVACSNDDEPSGGGVSGDVELTVFAAASLTDAFTQLGSDFQAANAGTTVTFNFGASSDLAASIESEGTADVFASRQRDVHG